MDSVAARLGYACGTVVRYSIDFFKNNFWAVVIFAAAGIVLYFFLKKRGKNKNIVFITSAVAALVLGIAIAVIAAKKCFY